MSLLLLFGGGAGANMSASTPTGTAGIQVDASTQYTAVASFRTAVTARSCRVLIRWYDSSGALLSTATGSSITDSSASWTQATVTATSHASAAYAAVVAEILSAAASEVHYIDKIDLVRGDSTTWVYTDLDKYGAEALHWMGV